MADNRKIYVDEDGKVIVNNENISKANQKYLNDLAKQINEADKEKELKTMSNTMSADDDWADLDIGSDIDDDEYAEDFFNDDAPDTIDKEEEEEEIIEEDTSEDAIKDKKEKDKKDKKKTKKETNEEELEEEPDNSYLTMPNEEQQSINEDIINNPYYANATSVEESVDHYSSVGNGYGSLEASGEAPTQATINEMVQKNVPNSSDTNSFLDNLIAEPTFEEIQQQMQEERLTAIENNAKLAETIESNRENYDEYINKTSENEINNLMNDTYTGYVPDINEEIQVIEEEKHTITEDIITSTEAERNFSVSEKEVLAKFDKYTVEETPEIVGDKPYYANATSVEESVDHHSSIGNGYGVISDNLSNDEANYHLTGQPVDFIDKISNNNDLVGNANWDSNEHTPNYDYINNNEGNVNSIYFAPEEFTGNPTDELRNQIADMPVDIPTPQNEYYTEQLSYSKDIEKDTSMYVAQITDDGSTTPIPQEDKTIDKLISESELLGTEVTPEPEKSVSELTPNDIGISVPKINYQETSIYQLKEDYRNTKDETERVIIASQIIPFELATNEVGDLAKTTMANVNAGYEKLATEQNMSVIDLKVAINNGEFEGNKEVLDVISSLKEQEVHAEQLTNTYNEMKSTGMISNASNEVLSNNNINIDNYSNPTNVPKVDLTGNVATLTDRLTFATTDMERELITTQINTLKDDIKVVKAKIGSIEAESSDLLKGLSITSGYSINEIKNDIINNTSTTGIEITKEQRDIILKNNETVKELKSVIYDIKSTGSVSDDKIEVLKNNGVTLSSQISANASDRLKRENQDKTIVNNSKEQIQTEKQKSQFKEDALHAFKAVTNVSTVKMEQLAHKTTHMAVSEVTNADKNTSAGVSEIKKYADKVADVATFIGLVGTLNGAKDKLETINKASSEAEKLIAKGKIDASDLNLSKSELKAKLKDAGVPKGTRDLIIKNKSDVNGMMNLRDVLQGREKNGSIMLDEKLSNRLHSDKFFNLKNVESAKLLQHYYNTSKNDVIREALGGKADSLRFANVSDKTYKKLLKSANKNDIKGTDKFAVKMGKLASKNKDFRRAINSKRLNFLKSKIGAMSRSLTTGDSTTSEGYNELAKEIRIAKRIMFTMSKSGIISTKLSKKILFGTRAGGYSGLLTGARINIPFTKGRAYIPIGLGKILIGTKAGGYHGLIAMPIKPILRRGKLGIDFLGRHAKKYAVQVGRAVVNSRAGQLATKGINLTKKGADTAKKAVVNTAKKVTAPAKKTVNNAKNAYKATAKKARDIAKKAMQTKAGRVASATANGIARGASIISTPFRVGFGAVKAINKGFQAIGMAFQKLKKVILVCAGGFLLIYLLLVMIIEVITSVGGNSNNGGGVAGTVLMSDDEAFIPNQIKRLQDKFATRKQDGIDLVISNATYDSDNKPLSGTPKSITVLNNTTSKYGHPINGGNFNSNYFSNYWDMGLKVYYVDSDGNIIQDGQNNIKDALILAYVQTDAFDYDMENDDDDSETNETKAIRIIDKWYEWLNESLGDNAVTETDMYFCDNGCDVLYYKCNDSAVVDNSNHTYKSNTDAKSVLNAGVHTYPANQSATYHSTGDYWIATCQGHDHGSVNTSISIPSGCDNYEIVRSGESYEVKCKGHGEVNYCSISGEYDKSAENATMNGKEWGYIEIPTNCNNYKIEILKDGDEGYEAGKHKIEVTCLDEESGTDPEGNDYTDEHIHGFTNIEITDDCSDFSIRVEDKNADVNNDDDEENDVAPEYIWKKSCNGHRTSTYHTNTSGSINVPSVCDSYTITRDGTTFTATCDKSGGSTHDHGTKRGTGVVSWSDCSNYSTQYYCTGHSIDLCYGHKDAIIKIPVKVMQDAFDEKHKVSGDGVWSYLPVDKPWTDDDIDWCQSLHQQDWKELYGIDPTGGTGFVAGGNLSPDEVTALLNKYKDTSVVRQNALSYALNAVGNISFYYGGKPNNGGYPLLVSKGDTYLGEAGKGTEIKDNAGRTRIGLDGTGFIEWVFWSATGGKVVDFGTMTTGEIMANPPETLTEISDGDLKVGDIGVGYGQIGIYAGKDNTGKKVWIYNYGSKNGVTKGYYTGFKKFYKITGVN